jgi:orotate phosphoribosyltransferase
MTDAEIRDVFTRTGAILKGHFLLASGLHSDTYVQCAKVMEHPREAEALCRELASRWQGVDAVAGPAYGGILPAYEIARHLGCRAVYFERGTTGKFELRRGFSIEGDRVLVAEDVITTGGSAKEVVDLAKAMGAKVVGVTSFVFRGVGKAFDEEYRYLLGLEPPTWKPADCPHCKQGSTAVKPGTKPCKA